MWKSSTPKLPASCVCPARSGSAEAMGRR
jgi:hypothetical protein